jgi:hypothetical protein
MAGANLQVGWTGPFISRGFHDLESLPDCVQGAVRSNWKKRTFVFMNEADNFEIRCEFKVFEPLRCMSH